MPSIAIIGAGITGVTTAYALLKRGFDVEIYDRHRYAAMETSFANGGQLSASNAEVWNKPSTILHALQWMLRPNAPLLINPKPSWHKYSWFAEFVAAIPKHRANTVETVRLALAARAHLDRMAADEKIDFDLERRGILHIYHDAAAFESARAGNAVLTAAGLERRAVTPAEIRAIEPALGGVYHAGFFTPSDATGDIHKFTRGLAAACVRRGALFNHEVDVDAIAPAPGGGHRIRTRRDGQASWSEPVDGVVICAGTASRRLASLVGDRVNVYPVKGYSITVAIKPSEGKAAPHVSLLDEDAKIVTSRLGPDRFRVAGTAEFNGFNRDIRNDRIQPLVDWTRRNFPGVSTDRIVPWAGLRPMMPNMMPRVGAGRRPGIFYNTGHGHLGWTLSPATAEIVTQVIETTLPRRHGVGAVSAATNRSAP